jgi:hypothetical protein
MSTNVKRSLLAHFLNTTPATTATYSRLGDGVVSAEVSYNPETTQETYIHEDSATTTVDSYAPNFPVEQTAKVGDDVFDYVDGLRQALAVGADAETDIVEVRLYETPSGTSYPATKFACSVQVDSIGGDGGTNTKINFTLNYQGDPIGGDFDTSTLVFTPAS